MPKKRYIIETDEEAVIIAFRSLATITGYRNVSLLKHLIKEYAKKMKIPIDLM